MEDTRMPKAVFFGQLKQGKRDRGAPRKRFKDQLKKQLSLAGIQRQIWQQEAIDRDKWRCSIRRASRKFETERSARGGKRDQRTNQQQFLPSSAHNATERAPHASASSVTRELVETETISFFLAHDPRMQGTSHHRIQGKKSAVTVNMYHSTHSRWPGLNSKASRLQGKQEPLLSVVKRRKLTWFGHVNRHDSLAKTILQGTVEGGRRRGR
ncbi:hypothetical protein ACOMHN_009023 [Nucella lapillus]